VQQVLARKNTGVIGVAPDDAVQKALEVMAAHDIGAVMALDGDRLVGILSERDYARKVELRGRSAAAARVRDIMTAEVVTVQPSATVEDCYLLMHQRRIRHLPVVAQDKVVGMLSSRDVLEEVIADEEKDIRDLETERRLVEDGFY
jgi:CBS domain-containing protein